MEDLGLKCNYCQQKGSNVRRCSRCLNVYYCSKACQSIEWPAHRQDCQKPSRTKNRTNLDLSQKLSTYATHMTEEYETAGEGTVETKDCQKQARDETSPVLKGKESQTTERQSPVVQKETGDNNMGAEKPANESADIDPESQGESSGPTGVACTHCGVLGCEKRCSRCQKAVYCFRHCQKQDWSMHKKACKEKMSEEDERIMKSYLKKKESIERFQASDNNSDYSLFQVQNFSGPLSRIEQQLTLEQAMMRATRPEGSMQAVVRKAKQDFPGFKIVTKFSDVPYEQFSFFMPLVSLRAQYILVAFMYRYHEHPMRHGVYLKDDVDSESKVEFYLDEYFDSPLPFFSYQQVKPGGYICLIKPEMHVFGDGTVGIRVNHPHEAVILDA